MKKKIKVYMLATQSPGSFGVYTLDKVYCFPTHEERRDFMEKQSEEMLCATALMMKWRWIYENQTC